MANSNKNEKVNVPSIQIDKNIISYSNSFICIDNISLISVSPIPSNMTWIGAVILSILSIAMISSYDMKTLGILALIAAIAWLAIVVYLNMNRGENLAISLNSGTTLYFNCRDKKFLNNVVSTMIKSINDKNKSTYTISFDKCTISGGVLNESKW